MSKAYGEGFKKNCLLLYALRNLLELENSNSRILKTLKWLKAFEDFIMI